MVTEPVDGRRLDQGSGMSARPDVEGFFDPRTFSVTYLVIDPESRHAALIDPVLDYDARAGRTATGSIDKVLARASERSLTIDWILETHVHADHLSAMPLAKRRTGARTGIGSKVKIVQQVFGEAYNIQSDVMADGRQFDRLFEDGDEFRIGGLEGRVLHVPGHTPACAAYLIGEACFVGDTLFMPDYGTARCDFPGGDPAELYRSIQRLLALPAETRLFTAHDYGPDGRAYAWESTVAEQRARNKHVRDGIGEAEFVRMRRARDATLNLPELMLPAIQVNIRAGELPPPEANGQRYLKIPLDRF